ncbi:ArnT family glycosyltransferase [Nostoc sp. PCC 7524]|uniref:ArnT family glycosyltransferase n=1 Tax=Nostoc sp. (strain ATCC 29411 / PCC 7524) TaxID=28072 RepID=UPI00059EDB61|nr:glycosyltransferase family 39 protein [Nostoc sp. PCC 7524]
MGQSILDGNLPYLELWDLKPPLAFFSYAFAMFAFGKSIISVRLFGTLCVIAAAILTYYICRSLWSLKISLSAAMLFIMLSGPLTDGKSVMTEHIALVPLLGALALLVRSNKLGNIKFFLVGLLMAFACMIRLNLAYVTLILGLYILAKSINFNEKKYFEIIAYIIGFLIPPIVLYLPYVITNNTQIFKVSIIDASLAYSTSQASLWQLIFQQIYNVWGIVFLIGIIQIIRLIKQEKNLSLKQNQLIYCTIFFFGTELSILKSGAAHNHYMIQLAPFFAVIFSSWFIGLLKFNLKAGYFILILTLTLVALPTLNEYKVVGTRFFSQQPLSYGREYELAQYLSQQGGRNTTIYMMEHHLVYWLLDIKPPTKIVTHPSNISREYLLRAVKGQTATTNQELLQILNQKPEFIVKKEGVWYLQDHPDAVALLEKTLQTQYVLLNNIEGTQIYRKI